MTSSVISPKSPAQTPAQAPAASKPQPAESKPYEPTPPQRKAIENIMRKYREKADSGEVDESVFKAMAEDCSNIKAAKDAVEFITKYRVRGCPPPDSACRDAGTPSTSRDAP